jgi:endoglucanase
MCLGVAGGSPYEGAAIYGWTCNGAANQYWNTILEDSGEYLMIYNYNSGMSLGIAGKSTLNGAAVVQWPYGGAANQLWYVSLVS